MNKPVELAELRAQGLLPFQVEVVLEFLRPGSDPVWEIASPPGTGKTRLGAAIARGVVERRNEARVLVLAPRALGLMWADALSQAVPATIWVDRRRFVELAAEARQGQSLWPTPGVVVMSIDFAKRDDVLAALREVQWDLVIGDEGHLLAGKRADAFFGLLKDGRARRGLLLTSLPSKEPLPFTLNVARRAFGWSDIKDWEGRLLVVVPKHTVEFVTYHRSSEELALLRDLEALAKGVSTAVPALRLQAALLIRGASSSLYAAERLAWRLGDALTHMRNLIVHGRAPEPAQLSDLQSETSSDVLEVESVVPMQLGPEASKAVAELAGALQVIVERLEDIPEDTKLLTLKRLVDDASHQLASVHICIWTGFLATAQYLSTALEGRGSPISRLTTSMGLNDREATVARFRTDGGILLTTGAAIEGVNLPFVDECVHYDLPVDPRALEHRLARFLWFGRTKPFRSIVLRDAAGGLAWEEALFRKLAAAMPTSNA